VLAVAVAVERARRHGRARRGLLHERRDGYAVRSWEDATTTRRVAMNILHGKLHKEKKILKPFDCSQNLFSSDET
jgi:hypothetical protein